MGLSQTKVVFLPSSLSILFSFQVTALCAWNMHAGVKRMDLRIEIGLHNSVINILK